MAQSNMTRTVGLALEGGGYRGMYTAGVLDVWMEHGLTCDHMVGVSAGAAFGYNFKSRQIGRAIRYNKAYCADKRYASVTSWLRTGDMFNADFAYHEVPIERDPIDLEAYRACPMRFTCVCTDIETGKAVYHDLHVAPGGGAAVGDLVAQLLEIAGAGGLVHGVIQLGAGGGSLGHVFS